MEAPTAMNEVSARVRRDGQLDEIQAELLVPGDIAILEGGDILSADMRIIAASNFQVDESALTGESMPVDKVTTPLPGETVLAERTNMLFKGTKVLKGAGTAVVTSTGMQTELGAISSLVAGTEDEKTPLEKKLSALGNKLIWITLGIAVIVAVGGILSGKELLLMIETAIALAVAAIPEGLPIVATIALARGMWRMAKKNALVNRLSAVETLGATSVICTDKTGTLTENRMTVRHLITPDAVLEIDEETTTDEPAKSVKETLTVGILCNNASLTTGDPMETALLSLGENMGIRRAELLERLPVRGEEAFDSETRMMATLHRSSTDCLFAVKGAPEAVLAGCSFLRIDGSDSPLSGYLRETWLEKNNELASEGLRVLAMAEKHAAEKDRPYENLVFLGFVTYLDPPREDVRPSIIQCRSAGIRVVMITGDQAETAKSIALQVGLEEPGRLKSVRGSDWIEPDALSAAQKAEVLDSVVFSRVSPKQKMDLIDLHQQAGSIVAMTGDGVNDEPALKKADIGVGEGDSSVMRNGPRDPALSIVSGRQWRAISVFSILMSLAVLGALAIALGPLGLDNREAVTVSFLTLAFAQLWHVFNMRGRGSRVFNNGVTRNRIIWFAIALCTALLVGAVYLPGISSVLRVTAPGATGWLVVLGMSLAPAVIGQVLIKLGLAPI